MRASELIRELQALLLEIGDVDIYAGCTDAGFEGTLAVAHEVALVGCSRHLRVQCPECPSEDLHVILAPA